MMLIVLSLYEKQAVRRSVQPALPAAVCSGALLLSVLFCSVMDYTVKYTEYFIILA